jgi:hypothetical protein
MALRRLVRPCVLKLRSRAAAASSNASQKALHKQHGTASDKATGRLASQQALPRRYGTAIWSIWHSDISNMAQRAMRPKASHMLLRTPPRRHYPGAWDSDMGDMAYRESTSNTGLAIRTDYHAMTAPIGANTHAAILAIIHSSS